MQDWQPKVNTNFAMALCSMEAEGGRAKCGIQALCPAHAIENMDSERETARYVALLVSFALFATKRNLQKRGNPVLHNDRRWKSHSESETECMKPIRNVQQEEKTR